MTTLAQKFLTPEQQERITRCVQEAEKLTSGEIVPMVVTESHSYPLAPVVGGTFFALPAALLAARLVGSHYWIGPDNMWLFLLFFVFLYIPAHQLVKRNSCLKRWFLSPQRIGEEVREAATTAFFTERLYKTKAENGILIYVSVFEHQVWILADRGINDKIPQQRWQEITDLIIDGIKNRRPCEAICEAVGRIGAILAEHFPIEKHDKNELHNLIIR